MTLRSYLTVLTLATLFPVAIFAAVVGAFLVQQDRETFRRGAEERTLALLTAVDAELRGSMTTLQALAVVPSLQAGDLAYFRTVARRVLESQPDWSNINLALPDGQQIINLQLAPGAALPNIGQLDGSFVRIRETRRPLVSDLATGAVWKGWGFTVRAPVVFGGELKYVLSAVVEPAALSRLVAAQGLPEGWVGVVLDRNHRIVARSVEPEKTLGQLASQSLRDALARAPSGWFRGTTIEGAEVYTPYRRSETTGWAFAMGIPASAVDGVLWRGLALLAIGLAGALALALAAARFVGRRISAPIATLVSATEAFGRGEAVRVPEAARVAEIGVLARTLQACVAAMREREERFRVMADAAPVLIWLSGTDGLCTWFNKAWLEFVGRTMADERGEGWVQNVHPDDVQRCLQAYNRAFDSRQPFEMEYRLRRHDGEFRWVLGRGIPRFAAQGAFAGYIGSCIDITDRRRAEETLRAGEERLRLAQQAGRMGSWEWDMRTNRVVWSRELEAIHGLAPGAFAGTFEAYRKDIHPQDRDRVQQAIAHSLERGDHHVEYRIVRPDGETRWVEGRGKVFRDASGVPLRVVGVCMDITERKQAEHALKEADRHKDEFIAMLSHELRNPLAALTTAAHVLRVSSPEEAGAIQARAVVDRQARHMAHLIEDLLDVSRITMGKAALEREDLELAGVVSTVVQTWHAARRLDGARLTLKASPVWVNADRVRLEQIFSNLLDNALKFSPPGEPIAVSVRQDGEEALLEVSDQGEGIASDVLGSVFELFTQGRHGLDRRKGGMGVGLALVKRLVEMHGGSVVARSAGPGRGAAFEVRLPAIDKPAQEAAPVPEPPPLGGRRVLVIEDNDDMRQMLSAALRLGGHEVSVASDGASGLAAAADKRPDVALIDIGLPDIDGYEVARRLRAAPGAPRIGLIALTGYGQSEDQHRAHDAGFDAHLTKPVAPEKLSQAIGALR